MPKITAVDPTQMSAQTGAPVAVSPDNSLAVTLPRSERSQALIDYHDIAANDNLLAGGRMRVKASAMSAAPRVSIRADGGKVVSAAIDPNKTYIFKDRKTGAIEIMGVGEVGARAAAARGQAISSANKKNKSDWRVYAVDDPNSAENTWGKAVLYDKHHKSVIGKIANFAAPVIGGVLGNLLLPGLGFALSGAIGAAGGSALSGVAQGKSIGNILKGAALSGLGAYAGGSILGNVGGAAGKVTSNLASSAIKDGLANGALGALSSATGNVAGSALGSVAGDLVVNGVRQAATSGIGSALGGAAGGALGSLGGAYVPPSNDIVVNAQPGAAAVPPVAALGIPAAGGLAASVAGGSTTPPQAVEGQPDITVTAQPQPSFLNAPELVTGALSLAGIDQMLQNLPSVDGKGFKPSATQILTALQLLGGIGGAGGASGGTVGGQALAPVFSKALPAPGANFGNRTPRAVNTDWATYATRPEESFFSNVPPPIRGYAEGGPIMDDLRVNAMSGGHNSDVHASVLSDGRSDDRPIMASDGEYVVDAETVALLGNGSPEAGARKLDEFRVNLRKQKGAALAQGKFTPPARMPEAYMGAM